jgi:putative Mn2+ efflux pump MntP
MRRRRALHDGLDAMTLSATAIGLAMDALAVALGLGLCSKGGALRCAVRVGLHFGLFQAGMTVTGWALGIATAGLVASVGSVLAAGLLWLIGAKMLVESARGGTPGADACAEGGDGPARPARDPSRGWSLVALSVATSIDAFCVGVGLAYLRSDVFIAAAIIGGVAAVLPGAGFLAAGALAGLAGRTASRVAEAAGGVILLAIGVKVALG